MDNEISDPFFFFLTSALYGQDAEEIISRYLDTVSNGNIDNWNKIKSIYAESEGYYSQQDFDHKVKFSGANKPGFNKSFILPPYGQRIDIYSDSTFSDLQSTFYFLKDKTIMVLGDKPPLVKPNTRAPGEFFSPHTPVFIRNVLRKSSATEMVGIKEFPLDAVWCYEIKVTTKGRNYYFYINTETYLLNYWCISPQEDQAFVVKFHNYRKIGDLLMPMSTSAMRNGVVYHWTNTRKIELNAEIDPNLFLYEP